MMVVVVGLFGLTFAYKNHQIVTIAYYYGVDFQIALPLLLIVIFALGLSVGYLICTVKSVISRRKKSRRPSTKTELKSTPVN